MACSSPVNLAWQSVSETVSEVRLIFQQLVRLCSFFQKSGLRTRELRELATSNNLEYLHLPKVFEVRWTEFTSDLLNAILFSWHALVFFFQSSQETVAKGFLSFITNIENMQLLVFLADTMTVQSSYRRYDAIRNGFNQILQLFLTLITSTRK